MFGFGKSTSEKSRSLNLGWDLHAHVLPAVDDGARTLDESLASILALKELGYSGCIITPHIYRSLYDNTRQHLEENFETLKANLARANVSFELRLAAEYFGDDHLMQLADTEPLLGFGPPTRMQVLVEFPYLSESLYWADVLSTLVRNGYQPVIAHPERYRYLAAELDTWLERFASFDAILQYDLGSLVGQYGKAATKTLNSLISRGMPHFWGSDLHRASQADKFIREAVRQVYREAPLNPTLDQSPNSLEKNEC